MAKSKGGIVVIWQVFTPFLPDSYGGEFDFSKVIELVFPLNIETVPLH